MENAPDNNPDAGTFAVVPQIYFDIIGRIIPGAIFIGLYDFDYISKSLTTFGFAILCSYFIGMILHIFSIKIYGWIFPNHKTGMPSNWFKNYSDTPIWEWIRHKVKPSEQDVYVKIMAEKSLFRNTALIAAIATFYPPDFLMVFGNVWSRVICAATFIILCFCTMTIHKWICQNQNDYDKHNKESVNEVKS